MRRLAGRAMYALVATATDVHRVRKHHEPSDRGELTYREAIFIVIAVAAGCALLLLAALWLIEP